MTTTVLLYGVLAKKFGKYWKLDVKSPAEAIRALRANIGQEFDITLAKYTPGFHVFLGKENIGKEELVMPSGRRSIRIVPVIAGAKAGVLQTLVGGILIVAGLLIPGAQGLVAVGASLVVGGVIQMLSPPPNQRKPNEKPDNLPSYTFDGPVNTTAQGQPVAVGYGHLRVGSAVVHAGIYSEQISTAATSISPTLNNPGAPLRMGNPLVARVIA